MCSQRTGMRRATSRRSTHLTLGALVLLALALAGCGGVGSGDLPSTQTHTIAASSPEGPVRSRPQLIARADAICARRNTAIDAVKLPGTKPKDIESFAARSTVLEQTAFLELGRLRPPASMARDWQQILADSRTLLEYVVKLDEYGEYNEIRLIPALAHSTQTVKHRLQVTATHAGFKHCSRLR